MLNNIKFLRQNVFMSIGNLIKTSFLFLMFRLCVYLRRMQYILKLFLAFVAFLLIKIKKVSLFLQNIACPINRKSSYPIKYVFFLIEGVFRENLFESVSTCEMALLDSVRVDNMTMTEFPLKIKIAC